MTCEQSIDSSDAICECGAEVSGPESGICYGELSHLASDEGNEIGAVVSAQFVAECQQSCSANDQCKSFAFCPQWKGCWMKDRSFTPGEATRELGECRTYYKMQDCATTTIDLEVSEPEATTTQVSEPEATTPEVSEPEATTPEVSQPEGDVCYGELTHLAVDEGNEIGVVVSARSAAECQQSCSAQDQCKSLSFCPQWKSCWMKDRSFTGGEATRERGACKTYYKTRGCSSSCEESLNNEACTGQFGSESCYTCGQRIDYLVSTGVTENLAKQRVADEFLAQCGACGSNDGSNRLQSDRYSLVWQDEFDGSGRVDGSKWESIHSHGNGFGNRESQFYTNRAENAWVSDGTLKIRARLERFGGRSYTSAKLQSRGDGWLYGKFSVRMRLLQGTARGTWAASWMMPRVSFYGGWPRSGEIDIMEHVGYDTGRVHGTVHTLAYHHSVGTQIGGSAGVDVKGWHTYTAEWRPDVILFACDGKVYQIFRKESDDTAKWPFDQPFYLILNMAVGGNWGGARGIDEDAFRGEGQIMEIDWVRVEQRV